MAKEHNFHIETDVFVTFINIILGLKRITDDKSRNLILAIGCFQVLQSLPNYSDVEEIKGYEKLEGYIKGTLVSFNPTNNLLFNEEAMKIALGKFTHQQKKEVLDIARASTLGDNSELIIAFIQNNLK